MITRKRKRPLISQVATEDSDMDENKPTFRSESPRDLADSIILEEQAEEPSRGCPMSERFVPRSTTDLALHSAKLKELRALLERCKTGRELLFVSGPPGCGKSTAVRVICANLRIPVKEWEEDETIDEDSVKKPQLQREEDQFFQFLRSGLASFSGTATVKLVRFLPSTAYSKLPEFRLRLRTAIRNSRQSIIFCLSEVRSCYAVNPHKIFSAQFVRDEMLKTMSLNPVAASIATRALKRARDLCTTSRKISDSILTKTSHLCEGDLRLAFNMLQFSMDQEGRVKELAGCLEANLQDNMFHMIARLLYAHRGPDLIPRPHWLPAHLHRPPTERDINSVLQMSTLPSTETALYLHDHVPAFSPTLPATANILEALSMADSMTMRWDVRQRLRESCGKADEYLSQIAARACYFNLSKTSENKKENQKFHSITRPKWKNLDLEIASLTEDLQQDFTIPRTGTKTKVLELAMYSRMRTSPADEVEVLSYLTRPYSFPWTTGRVAWQCRQLQRRQNGTSIRKSHPLTAANLTSTEEEDEKEEKIIIENSDEDQRMSEDSFDDDPFN